MEVKKKIFIKARERVDSTILTANSTGADSADNQPKSAFSAFMFEDEEEDENAFELVPPDQYTQRHLLV
jgi:predicted lactoylglutathione lyase